MTGLGTVRGDRRRGPRTDNVGHLGIEKSFGRGFGGGGEREKNTKFLGSFLLKKSKRFPGGGAGQRGEKLQANEVGIDWRGVYF